METIDLRDVRIFDVLRSSLNGQLGVVMCVTGQLLDMRDKTGAVARYKFGKHFTRVAHDEAVEFRALAREARKHREKTEPGKKRSRTVSAFLNKLAKKR